MTPPSHDPQILPDLAIDLPEITGSFYTKIVYAGPYKQ